MLLTSISTDEQLRAALDESGITSVAQVLNSLVNEIQIHLMAAPESRVGKAIDCRDTGMGWRQSQQESKLAFHKMNPQVFVLNNQTLTMSKVD